MTTVELILETGSNAGVRAIIHEGYYMVGRHPECQIRPKSKSVSRRHCLIHHAAGEVRIFDLQSTTGTIINATRLNPKTWRKLKDDDQIRCGKVLFRLSVSTGQEPTKVATEKSMPAGEAWHDVDVAEFLDDADEADREIRYQNIREGGRNESTAAEVGSDTSAVDPELEFDTEIESIEETFADETITEETFADEPEVSRQDSAPAKEKAKGKDKQKGRGKDKDKRKQKSAKPKKISQPPKLKKPKKLRTGPSFSFSLASLRDAEQLKLIGLVLVAISILGFFGYRVYQFSAPSSVRVVEELKY